MRWRRICALMLSVGVILGVAACAATLPSVTSELSQRSGLSAESLRRGRSLYVAKCSGCHALYSPSHYASAEQWRASIAEMSVRSRLSDDEPDVIAAYLIAASAVRR
ncbi:cytochrome c [Candidatus Poribacteria bacterium]|nr:cytochrome c [Candidatus Poribacteria bacterium]